MAEEKNEHIHDEKHEHIEKNEDAKKENEELKKENHPKTDDLKKTEKKQVEKPKKSFAEANAYNLPISTKTAMYISKFIKGKTISSAIMDLEDVIRKKKAVPYKGEIPHRKGKIMSGRYPKKASLEFIRLLKSLSSNATYVGIQVPIISEAISNLAPRPFGKFGAVRRKRTQVKLKAVEAKEKQIQNRRKIKGKMERRNKMKNKFFNIQNRSFAKSPTKKSAQIQNRSFEK